jgi:GNAT superfamily N-acetyltransferase
MLVVADMVRWRVFARIYLGLHDTSVAGYVSLTTGSVRPDDAPKRFARGMPRYPIGTIVIARLAVDHHHHHHHHHHHQRQRLGSRLLAEALHRALAASDAAARPPVVVGAIDDNAAAFYRRWGFIDTPDNPHRLYREMSDIRTSFKT